MNHDTPATTPARKGAPLRADLAAELRSLLADRTPRSLARDLGVSERSLERAAAGAHLVAGTRLLIEVGLDKFHAAAAEANGG